MEHTFPVEEKPRLSSLALFLIVGAVLLGLGVVWMYKRQRSDTVLSPLGNDAAAVREKPLEKYSFEALKKRTYSASTISFDERVESGQEGILSYQFHYTSDGKKVTGLATLPTDSGKHPVIIMFRGFVDHNIYTPGVGTKKTGEVFAKNGFITLAPDFLGYGHSASPSASSIEERFETYTTGLNLLASVKSLSSEITKISSGSADVAKVGIWGHSNGGHIALAILEISGKEYPTVLWAPVTKPFPYSVLYFTDEFEDNGKALRKAIADFEGDYDIEKYSLSNYLDWIKAPIQLHQGGGDEAVPQKWSNQFVARMKKLKKDITYFTYPGNDHNLAPDAWSTAVSRSIEFYRKEFAKKENP